MKKLIVSAMIGVFLLIGVSASNAITRQVGVQGQCDTALTGCVPIPLQAQVLCSSGCPLRSGYSKTESNRFWGALNNAAGACVTSTDGGTTWVACVSQPFDGTSVGNEQYQGASDGAVISVISLTAPNRCVFARSTNNAVTWNTVATLTGNRCDISTLEGMYLYCDLSMTCVFPSISATGFITYKSLDDGITWSISDGPVVYGVSSFCGASYKNLVGMIQPCQSIGSGNRQSWNSAVGVWGISGAWGGSGECWGSFDSSNASHAVCSDGITYSIRSASGIIEKSIVLPGATVSISTGGTAYALYDNVIYVFASLLTPSRIGVYVSKDGGDTFVLLAGISTVTTRGGNAFNTNGCIYATVGGPSRFVRIC